jgi:hypothetical protein
MPATGQRARTGACKRGTYGLPGDAATAAATQPAAPGVCAAKPELDARAAIKRFMTYVSPPCRSCYCPIALCVSTPGYVCVCLHEEVYVLRGSVSQSIEVDGDGGVLSRSEAIFTVYRRMLSRKYMSKVTTPVAAAGLERRPRRSSGIQHSPVRFRATVERQNEAQPNS